MLFGISSQSCEIFFSLAVDAGSTFRIESRLEYKIINIKN
jgi:hypothetical protein